MRLQDIETPAKPGFVLVECVWPESRGPKEDCRAGTGIVWAGHGDVQEFPASLWWRLAPHPDVWRLVDPEAAAQAIAEAQERKRQALLAEAIRANGGLAAPAAGTLATSPATPPAPPAGTTTTTPSSEVQAANDKAAADAAAAKAEGAQTNTDVVSVMMGPMTAEQLEALQDDEIRKVAEQRGYAMHPRWGRKTMIARFLEAQESQASGGNADGASTEA